MASSTTEAPARIEPCELETLPPALSDTIVDLARHATMLGGRLHTRTASSLAELVAIMNIYYSNLIEGHRTRPRDIERALADELDTGRRRDLQLEARAHVHVQRELEESHRKGHLPEPASCAFIQHLHRRFYENAPPPMLAMQGASGKTIQMVPGAFRSESEHDVAVGRHLPPSSETIERFMEYFEQRFRLSGLGSARKLVAIAAAHHRFNYIHPFPDGNGRVSRLMSHAMFLDAGVGAHGLWSISRGLARGLRDRGEYRQMMDAADSPRTSDTDGRGNLSLQALIEFVTWFLEVARDQVLFMSSLFELERLRARLGEYVTGPLALGPEARNIVDAAFLRGSIARGEASGITGRPERTARVVLAKLLKAGLLASDTPKGDVSLRFTSESAEFLFPRLFGADAADAEE